MSLLYKLLLFFDTADATRSAVRSSLACRVWPAKMLTLFSSVLLGMACLFHSFQEDAPTESVRQSKSAMMATHRRRLAYHPCFTDSLFAIMARFAAKFGCIGTPFMQLFCRPRPTPDVFRLGY